MKKDDLYTIRCIYCKCVYIEKIVFKDIIYITKCKRCGEDSKIEIGDLNAITEIYRGNNNDSNIITTRKI